MFFNSLTRVLALFGMSCIMATGSWGSEVVSVVRMEVAAGWRWAADPSCCSPQVGSHFAVPICRLVIALIRLPGAPAWKLWHSVNKKIKSSQRKGIIKGSEGKGRFKPYAIVHWLAGRKTGGHMQIGDLIYLRRLGSSHPVRLLLSRIGCRQSRRRHTFFFPALRY